MNAEEPIQPYRQLAAEALAHWNLQTASLDLVKLRENAVFRVETPEGERYALRIHRPGYHDDTSLESEFQWMQALQAAGVTVPRAVPARDGRLFIVLTSADLDRPRQIDLFDWLEGKSLGTAEAGPDGDQETLCRNFRTIGELAARVHTVSDHWTPPPGFARHAWDSEGLVGENPLWGRFWDLPALSGEERDLMRRMRTCIREDLAAYGQESGSYGLIHADMVPDNLLVNGGHIRLIDFDDTGFGWYLFEIATSLYFCRELPGFTAIQDALLEGYRCTRTLSNRDIDFLPLFLLARGTTYLGWVHTRPETETAREFTPTLIRMACTAAEDYLRTGRPNRVHSKDR